MAYAEKRDDKLTGYWYGKVIAKDGKRYRRRYQNKRDAEAYETFVRMMGYEPPNGDAGNTAGRTFAEVYAEAKLAGGKKGRWLAGRDPSGVARREYVVSVLGNDDIGDINRAAMEKLVANLRARPALGKKSKLTPATINRYVAAVDSILSYAVAHEYIKYKPKLEQLKEMGGRQSTLTFEQEGAVCRALVAAGEELEAFLIGVLSSTGMRLGELYKLRADQIENEWVNIGGDQTKNDEARRVWIEPNKTARLRALVRAGGLPKTYQLLRRFKKACKACGLEGDLVLHSLRHTRQTRLRKAGVDLKLRMQMLGHKSIVSAQRYDHIDDDDQLEAAKKVEEARGLSGNSSAVLPFLGKLTG